jgi:hypothetical protein
MTAVSVFLVYPLVIFFIVLDPLSRVASVVDSRTLSPKGDISITKRNFVGNG